MSSLQRGIDSLLAAYARPGAPGASVLVVRDGRTIVSRSYGLADLAAGTPATPETNYRLASLTKQFTATAILLLAADGALRYDDSVSRFLPQLPACARGVTIRQLLTHTSGLPAYEDFVPDSQTTQVHDRDVPALIAHADSLYFPAGSSYRYSNTGYALLALIVERASGASFASFLRDRIFTPLGMNGSVAFEEGVSTVPRRAFGYSERDGRWVRTDQSSTSAVLGDGGIYTSIADLARWDRALDAHTLVSEKAQGEAWTAATLTDGRRSGYGFGWFVDDSASGVRLRHHGETRGFTNAILKIPSRRLTIVLLTNRTGGDPWDLAARIAELPELR
ncbi:MAG TPA: serine hydrolase domain-containing protein [Gemmatimonadaceae bacterium]|nr:serine hydrolase domain-containing protein [Gemmatimonadaceae bacterium]